MRIQERESPLEEADELFTFEDEVAKGVIPKAVKGLNGKKQKVGNSGNCKVGGILQVSGSKSKKMVSSISGQKSSSQGLGVYYVAVFIISHPSEEVPSHLPLQTRCCNCSNRCLYVFITNRVIILINTPFALGGLNV